jgi:hypothetical protein
LVVVPRYHYRRISPVAFTHPETTTMLRKNSSRLAPFATFLLGAIACVWSTSAFAQDQWPVKPTPQHELLKNDVGTWDADVKMWPGPETQPIESKATEKNELARGDMWLLSRFEGSFGDMKYAGYGTFGYDPAEKKYVGTWIDSMSPYLTTMKGDYDPATKTMTAIGAGRDAMTGKQTRTKHVSQYVDDDTRTFQMYMTGDDGKEFKVMEITYHRRAQ